MNISIHPETGALSLAGALEIYEAEAVRHALMEYLERGSAPVLDLIAVESCDTAGAQLLWAARQSAAHRGKTLRFEHIPQAVLESWRTLGLPEAVSLAAAAS